MADLEEHLHQREGRKEREEELDEKKVRFGR